MTAWLTATGLATAYNIYVSESDKGEAALIYTGTMAGDNNTKDVLFGFDIKVRTFIFEITGGVGGYGSCADFYLFGPSGTAKTTVSAANLGKATVIGAEIEDGSSLMEKELSREGWTVTASSAHQGYGKAENMLDGNIESYWHSNYTEESSDSAPYTLTFTLPKAQKISGFSYWPRLDNLTGIAKSYNIYTSESDDGDIKKIYSGDLDGTMCVQYVDFGFNINAKKVIFEIISGNFGYGTCAEFYLYASKDGNAEKTYEPDPPQADGKPISDKSRWTAKASSEVSWGTAASAIDGTETTIWHTHFTTDGKSVILSRDKCPHTLEITLPEKAVISGFSYLPRQDLATGRVIDYEFYASATDDGEWFKINEGTFENNASAQTVDFLANTSVKKVMFKILSSVDEYGSVAELDILSENPKYEKMDDYNELLTHYKMNSLSRIDPSEISATASSEWGENSSASLAVDGSMVTFWHSHPDDKGKYPYTLHVDLGDVHSVREIVYYPRVDRNVVHGFWLEYSVWAGTDENNMVPVLENVSLDESADPYTLKFDDNVTARYFEFEITSGVGGYATCMELAFFEAYRAEASANTKYTLKIGSDIIKIEDGDGVREIRTDVAPYIESGYTQIPIRGLLEQMGAEIEWDGEYNKITIKADGTTVKMQIYNNLVNVITKRYGDVRYTLTSVPQIKDSRTFVPLRFISENLGYNVSWNSETQEIVITK